MRLLSALARLAIVLILLPSAIDWRSPVLSAIRPWALCALVAAPLVIAAVEVRLWRRWRADARLLQVLHGATLVGAVLVLACTLALEARFQWMRHEVLRADAQRLQRLGRHVIVGYRDVSELRVLAERGAIAGIFVTGHNVHGRTTDEIKREIATLQSARRANNLPPLWVAADQEGGTVSRLSPPLPHPPPLSDLVRRFPDAVARDAAVRQFAAQQGRALADLGINVNFAPVVDLNRQVINQADRFTRIHDRAIAADPHVVTEVARQYCAALWEAGVHCTLKHFPGLGRVFEDTHRESADLTASLDDLTAADWIPFRSLMADAGTLTMLGHVRLAALDHKRPASFSRRVVAGLLRQQWQQSGILVTDDFCMAAVYDHHGGIGAAAVAALDAEVDLILVSFDPDQYYPVMHALLRAERDGKLRQDALRQSEDRLRAAWGDAWPTIAGAAE